MSDDVMELVVSWSHR